MEHDMEYGSEKPGKKAQFSKRLSFFFGQILHNKEATVLQSVKGTNPCI